MPGNPPKIGYSLLSSLIASGELNIFRGFQELNARNILYLQSELAELQETLHDLDEAYNDTAKGNDIWSVPRSWRAVKKEGNEYLECVLRLRTTSKEYYRALQTQAWLLKQKSPTTQAHKTLRDVFNSHGSDISQMDASFLLDDRYRDDLVNISWEEKEVMTEFLQRFLCQAFEVKRISTPNGEMLISSDQRIRSAVRLLAIVLSSVLPILSIVVLYVIKRQDVRLGMIVLFSALCSVALATLSNARNAEIMAVTAA
ncbi:hypothetical protein N7504_001656 [Penicillium tannophilum]|nr:hypothetical protein N7504_001656 [Penicillium tannophilum]